MILKVTDNQYGRPF